MHRIFEIACRRANIVNLRRLSFQQISRKSFCTLCNRKFLISDKKKLVARNVSINESELSEFNANKIDMLSNSNSRFKDVESIENEKSHYKELESEQETMGKEFELEETTILTEENKQLLIEKFNNNLTDHIRLCVHCNDLLAAYDTICFYYKKSKNMPLCSITKPDSFNILMHGFAEKGNMDKILDLMRLMKKCEVDFTPQTFAACFECIARLPINSETRSNLDKFCAELESNYYTFQDLFDKCIYIKDQREYVLKAVRRLNPNFAPYYCTPVLEYSNSLLVNLNGKTTVFRSPAEELIADETMNNLIEEQLQNETNLFMEVKSVASIMEKNENSRRKWDELQNLWRMSVREGFARETERLKLQQINDELSRNLNIYSYLNVLPVEDYIDIIMAEANRLIQEPHRTSITLGVMFKEIGIRIKLKYDLQCKQQDGILSKTKEIYKEYCNWYLHPEINKNSRNSRQQWQYLDHKFSSTGPSTNSPKNVWSAHVLQEIGQICFQIIKNDVKVNVNMFTETKPKYVPAFYRVFRYKFKHIQQQIKPHSRLLKLYRETWPNTLLFDAKFMPMISPPVPWTELNSGSFIVSQVDFMRGVIEQEESVETFYPAFDGVNQLVSVPWKINEPILDVMLKVFQNGGSELLNVPQYPSKLDFKNFVNRDKETALHNRFLTWRRKVKIASWYDARDRLSLANHYRDRIFWFPHNTDFRGRAFPVTPLYFAHVGSDPTRALLKFAKGKKLGPKGLDWLKIHCVNLAGQNGKKSIEERLRYADEVLPLMLDSAEKPLTGTMWWTLGEKMWQVLACCMEIKTAFDSGDAENFLSCFPVHQDGSFNCMQHFAALTRDQTAAENVNLTPTDKPRDLYDCVVALIEKERLKDVENGVETAKNLQGFITRRVLKKTIMATVYGLTKHGCQLLLLHDLKDEKYPQESLVDGSWYLRDKVFSSFREMFTYVNETQNWFSQFSKYASKTYHAPLQWKTPLGQRIVQPYSRKRTVTIDKNYGEIKCLFTTFSKRPFSIRQRKAFPPNFIHSLDACHMTLTSIFCERENVTLVSIHDCFWTHACSVDSMNKICREQFVAMHSQPILKNLAEFNMQKFGTRPTILLELPRQGTYNLNDVLQSTYFFS